ncbi:protein tramtrack, beta isoform isoform X4 [Nasonia vitripennis]|uniref:BTB domain-containing protein n=1 Tax=Nasonia vitripennis TaxID=7425 RepID=A0A7M7Q4F3_NASVI|nr:protein tramtrack, beta isoform isoform X4 [Nasonia vitripennis]
MLADINGNLADLRSEAAMASQRFCLRWNNHQSNLLSVFDQLLHDESFVDVTLAVEGQLLRAHKMVLSACSPYFQALFTGHPDKHPIVILKDVPYVDMRSLLDFMYRGEVSVDQDRLTAFLRVAESLRIKGLTEVNEDKCDLPSITSSLLGNQNASQPPPPSLHRINQLGQHHHMPQKRYHHMSSHPLLGSALTAPKRKRGRPRKLSGSSDTPMDTSLGQDQQCSGADLVQGSPEMMEMKMGLDFQSEAAQNSSAGSSASNASNNANNGQSTPSKTRDEPTENGTDQAESGLLVRIKGEPEPTPGTSAQGKDEAFTRPLSRQGSESFKQGSLPSLPSDITFEICGSSTPPPPQRMNDNDYAEDFDDSDSTSINSSSAPQPHEEQHQQTVISRIGDELPAKSGADAEGVHFLSASAELRPCKEPEEPAQEPEPEVRKQVGWHPAALRALAVGQAVGHRSRRAGAQAQQRRLLVALARSRAQEFAMSCASAAAVDRTQIATELRPRI